MKTEFGYNRKLSDIFSKTTQQNLSVPYGEPLILGEVSSMRDFSTIPERFVFDGAVNDKEFNDSVRADFEQLLYKAVPKEACKVSGFIVYEMDLYQNRPTYKEQYPHLHSNNHVNFEQYTMTCGYPLSSEFYPDVAADRRSKIGWGVDGLDPKDAFVPEKGMAVIFNNNRSVHAAPLNTKPREYWENFFQDEKAIDAFVLTDDVVRRIFAYMQVSVDGEWIDAIQKSSNNIFEPV